MSELEWLAGYLEGEGSFRMSGTSNGHIGTPSVRVAATDRDVVERAAREMGVARVYDGPGATPNRKWVYRAEANGPTAIALMERLLPYMGLRRAARITEVLAAAAARPGHSHGEQYRNAKLTDQWVREIRQLAGQIPQVEIARRYGVSQALVSLVIRGRTWRHVEGTTVNTLIGA